MKLRVKSDEIINALETNVWIIDLDGGYSLIFGRLNHEYISLAYGKKSEDNQFLSCFDFDYLLTIFSSGQLRFLLSCWFVILKISYSYFYMML